jgi:hypothetical protein
VLKNGTPELIPAVEKGEVTVKAAAGSPLWISRRRILA